MHEYVVSTDWRGAESVPSLPPARGLAPEGGFVVWHTPSRACARVEEPFFEEEGGFLKNPSRPLAATFVAWAALKEVTKDPSQNSTRHGGGRFVTPS